jgi:hypothetical protein
MTAAIVYASATRTLLQYSCSDIRTCMHCSLNAEQLSSVLFESLTLRRCFGRYTRLLAQRSSNCCTGTTALSSQRSLHVTTKQHNSTLVCVCYGIKVLHVQCGAYCVLVLFDFGLSVV